MTIGACAKFLLAGDKEKFLATIITPIAIRKVLFPLFAFNLEVSRIPWVTSDTILAEIRLNWWEEEIKKIALGQVVKNHEILSPLADMIRDYDLPHELFLSIINARRFDIYSKPHNSLETQIVYIKSIFSSLFELAYRSCSRNMNKSNIECSRDFGFSLGVANLMLAFPRLVSGGRHPIFYKCNDKNLNKVTAQHPEELLEGFVTLAEKGLNAFYRGRKNLNLLHRNEVPILFCAASSNIVLDSVRKEPRRVFDGSCNISPLRRFSGLLIARLTGMI